MRQELTEHLIQLSINLERIADANEKIATKLASIDIEAWNELKSQLQQPPPNPFLEEHLNRIQVYTQATQGEIEAIRSKILNLSKETTMTLSQSILFVTRLAFSGYTIPQILNYKLTPGESWTL